jgi:cytochrome P450
LREEIRKVMYNNNEKIELNNENTKEISYLNYVIKESMRMFPPVAVIPLKRITKDVVLGGYKIPKGNMVQISVSSIQMDPEVYGDPNVFRPERWSEEEQLKRKIPLYSWIPFSQGPRVCKFIKYLT